MIINSTRSKIRFEVYLKMVSINYISYKLTDIIDNIIKLSRNNYLLWSIIEVFNLPTLKSLISDCLLILFCFSFFPGKTKQKIILKKTLKKWMFPRLSIKQDQDLDIIPSEMYWGRISFKQDRKLIRRKSWIVIISNICEERAGILLIGQTKKKPSEA